MRRWDVILLVLVLSFLIITPQESVHQIALKGEREVQNPSVRSPSFTFPYGIDDEGGELLLSDGFTSEPLGYDTQKWQIESFGEEAISWKDGSILGLSTTIFSHTILSTQEEIPFDSVTKIAISFTSGDCYFGMGWVDSKDTITDEWIVNLRLAENGIFIDYWDKNLFLVTIRNGSKSATRLNYTDLTQMQDIAISISKSLVRVDINDQTVGYLTANIPIAAMKFFIVLGGNHYLSKSDTLFIDYLQIYNRREPPLDTPFLILLNPLNNSQVSYGERIDFHLYGDTQVAEIALNRDSWSALSEPWDVTIPEIEGIKHLTIEVRIRTDLEEFEMHFEYDYISSFDRQVQVMTRDSVFIDGIIDEQEVNVGQESSIKFYDEGEQGFVAMLSTAYCGDALYVGIRFDFDAGYYTACSLMLDANQDGLWKQTDAHMREDFQITQATPTAFTSQTCITSICGDDIPRGSIEGLEFASGLRLGEAHFEFLVPLEYLNANTTMSTSIGICLIEGGIKSSSPATVIRENSKLLRLSPVHSQLGTVLALVSMIGVSGGLVGVFFITRRRGRSLRGLMTDETRNRAKIIIQAYDTIEISKLSLMVPAEEEVLYSIIPVLFRKTKNIQVSIQDGIVHRQIVQLDQSPNSIRGNHID